jgi:probable HAF family extracellular repeat protein
MKRGSSAISIAIAFFTTLAIPGQLAAQDNQDHNHHKQVRYSIKVLGTLGGTYSEAVGINNSGEAAGTSTPPGDQVVHATLWRNGVIIDLGTLGGANSVAPEAAPQPNKRVEVAGASNTATLDPKAMEFCSPFIFLAADQYVCQPFVWRHGIMVELPTLGGNNGIAWQVNNRGLVTGIAENATPDPTCPDAEPEGKPVIWEGDEIRELPTVSGDPDGATQAINDHGQAVGFTGNCISGVPFTSLHAVLWQRHAHSWTATDLGNLGGTILNLAFGINNRAQVVGQSALPGNAAFHAFLWQDGMMTDLGTLPGDVVSWAETINSRGEAVGTSFDASGNTHPFLWQNGVMTNLNTLIPADSPMFLLEALGNNDLGQIVGFGQLANGDVHAYVLTPCDENHDDDEGCEDGAEASTAPRSGPFVQRPMTSAQSSVTASEIPTRIHERLGWNYGLAPRPQK